MPRKRSPQTPRPDVVPVPTTPAQPARRLTLCMATGDSFYAAAPEAERLSAALAALSGAGPLSWQAVQLHATHWTIIVGVEHDAL